MKKDFFITILITIFMVGYENTSLSQVFKSINADSLVLNIDKYRNTKVEVEGIVIHICGVDGKKMKLKTESGAIIKIVPKDSLDNFDNLFYKKRVKVQGIVKEYRIEKNYIDKMEKEKTLLCHIDNTPCKDSAWVNDQIKKGNSDAISKQDIDKLRSTMEQKRHDYVSVITIFSEKVEIIE